MTPSKVLLTVSFGFLGGVAAGLLLPFSWLGIQLGFTVLVALVLLGGVYGHSGAEERSGQSRALFLLFALLAGAFLAGFIYAAAATPQAEGTAPELFVSARSELVERTQEVVGGVERGMFLAMVLGWRDELTNTVKQVFNRTGTRHILAISGMHLTIVAVVLLQLLVSAGLMRTSAFWTALVGIVLFIFLVGSPPSAVRAGIMAGLYLTAKQVGRMAQAWRLLVVAAAVMVLFNPHILVGSVGFQLSFLAVLGIILFKPLFDTLLSFVKWGTLRDLLSLSLAAQITTWPVLAGTFGRVSLIGPIANLVAVPLLPVVMILGLTFLLVGWTSVTAAQIVLYPAWALLHTLFVFLQKLSVFPWAEVSVGTVAPALFVGYYLLLAGVYWWGVQKVSL